MDGAGDAIAYALLVIMVLATAGVLVWLALDQRKLASRLGAAEVRVAVVDEASAARAADTTAYAAKGLQGVQGSVKDLAASTSAGLAGVSSSNAAAVAGLRSDLGKGLATGTLTAQQVKAAGSLTVGGGTVLSANAATGALTVADKGLQVDGPTAVGRAAGQSSFSVGGSSNATFSVFADAGTQYASVALSAGGATQFRAVGQSNVLTLGSASASKNWQYATLSNGVLGVQAAATFGAPLTLAPGADVTLGGSNCVSFGKGAGTMCFARSGADTVELGSNLAVSKGLTVGSNLGAWPTGWSSAGVLTSGVFASGTGVAVGRNGVVAAAMLPDGSVTASNGLRVTSPNVPLVQYAPSTLDQRWGVGQFNNATRVYSGSSATAPTGIKLGFARADGGFNDVLSVDPPANPAAGGSGRVGVAGNIVASGDLLGKGGQFGMAIDATTSSTRAFAALPTAGATLSLSRRNPDGTFADTLSVDSNNTVTVRGGLRVCDVSGNNCRAVALQGVP